MENASDHLVSCFVWSLVVNAALRFYNSTTVISGKKDQSPVKKQVTKTLNVTTDPEEKRRIIGDTFIKVSLFRQVLICCDAQLIWDWSILDGVGGGGGCFKRGWGLKQSLRSAIFTNYHEPFCSIQNFLLGKPKLSKLQASNNSSLGKISVYGAFHLTCAMACSSVLCLCYQHTQQSVHFTFRHWKRAYFYLSFRTWLNNHES